MNPNSPRQGRPTLAWLDATETAQLPAGTAVSIEPTGRHAARTIGRITTVANDCIELDTPRGEVSMPTREIKRARVIDALYEPGDPVLLRHVPAASWRGGVVRCDGTNVLVELIDGTFAWHGEAALEPADARDPVLPKLPRGPVPAIL